MALEEIVSAAFGAWRTRHRPRLRSLGLYAVAASLAMLGALYLSYAVFLALAEQAGPPMAAALTAALLLLMAILLVLVALLINRAGHRREPDSDEAALAEVLLRMGELFGHKIERPATTLVVTALVGGLVAGVSPAARRFLLNLAHQLFKEMTGEPK